MLKLEDLKPGLPLVGLEPASVATVAAVVPIGDGAVQVFYRTPDGTTKERLLGRDDEATLSVASVERPWSFGGDGAAFQLTCEAKRIDLAFLFDPMMAVHTSNVDPLPHQITAVYESMLPRQPLRFVLADDPGAGKTIMAGLYIRELVMRADAHRILIVAPGSLVEQWRDELYEKFGLEFRIFSSELEQASPSGNPFEEHSHLIIRLDQLSRRYRRRRYRAYRYRNQPRQYRSRGARHAGGGDAAGGDRRRSFGQYPCIRAFADQGPIHIVQIDAHLDFVDVRHGVRHGHGNPMRRAAEKPYVQGITALGIRNVSSTAKDGYEAARAMGDDILSVRQVRKLGTEGVLSRIPKDARLYVTIDIDGFCPSIAPGTGTPSHGGFLYYDVLEILQGVARRNEIVGLDLVEVAPDYDHSGSTAILAAQVLLNFLGFIFHARKGG